MVIMILGNPYNFSVFIKTIKEWNIGDEFCLGVLLFCIDGNIFPKEIVTATLRCEIPPLKEKLKNLVTNERLYNLQKDKAFVEIYNITIPEDISIDNDYCFDITPESFEDENCYVFAVSNGNEVRIMAAKLNYNVKESRHELNNIEISETFMAIDELNKILSQLDMY